MASEKRTQESYQELQLLEALYELPEARQIDLATRIDVSVGTVNWHLKRLAAKGLIKVKQIGRWRWQYLLTPKGIAEKTKLTAAYVQASLSLYRQIRTQALDYFRQIQAAGFDHIRLEGQGDLLDICRLTCLEQKIKVVPNHVQDVPVIRQVGRGLQLEWPEAIYDPKTQATPSKATG